MGIKEKAFQRALERAGIDKVVDREKAQRIKKATEDFWFFCRYYLEDFFYSEPAPYQRILIDIINKNSINESHIEKLKEYIHSRYHALLYPIPRLKGIVDIEPREHGKSVRMSFANVLWRILTGKSRFIVIIAASQKDANKILRDIKYELIDNPKIIEDFGNLKGEVWTADFIELKNGCAIAARGAGASVRGIRHRQFRPDYVVCDDILKDEAARSPVQRENIYDWFKRAVIPLGKNAFIVVVNTIFHYDDLPSRLLREIEERTLKGWLGLRFSAIRENGKPLWESYWSLKDLEEKKLVIGSAKFATEYMNEPVSDEDALFKAEWITHYAEAELPPRSRLEVVMGVDPALGKEKGDFSAYVVAGKDKETGLIYVLETFAKRVSPSQFAASIVNAFKRYEPKRIIFETVAFQEFYKDTIMREASKLGVHLPIRPIKNSLSKKERIMRLVPLVENGLLRFRDNQRLLIDQLLMFPKGDHDDLPDALEMAVSGLERPTETKSAVARRYTRPLF